MAFATLMTSFPSFFKMRKLKTTSEPLETTESALEMQQQNTQHQAGGNTIILNPALHSAAANLTSGSRLASGRSRTSGPPGSKKPPALVLTKDNSHSNIAEVVGGRGGPGSGSSAHSHGGSSPGWKVTFPDIEIHSPREIQPDNASISSRGTSSTVGYR